MMGGMEGGFRIGRWTAKPSLNQLTCGARIVRLEPKVMRVLVCLAEARGAVVPREQLIEDVWEGVHVVEGAVGRAVYQLRKALASAGENETYIETVRQVGFRLCGDVTPLKLARPDSRPFAGEPFRLRDLGFVVCAAVLVGGVALERMAPVFQATVTSAPVTASDIVQPAQRELAGRSSAQVANGSASAVLREAPEVAHESLRRERMAARQALRAERRMARQLLLEERMAANRALREAIAQERRELRGLILASAGAGPQAPAAAPPPAAPAPPEAPPAPEPPSPA
jgi:DNA-binding winged helix-turn-helix (wHTH) protein